MNVKVLTILGCLFVFQTVISCIPCNCADSKTFSIHYEGVRVVAYDISGFNPIEASGPIFRNAFGLGVVVNFERERIGCILPTLGFNSSTACSCFEDEFRYEDDIVGMEIFLTDTQTELIIDFTSKFKIAGYGNSYYSIQEYFSDRQKGIDGFQLELDDYTEIPDLAILTINVKLESGAILTASTDAITFVD